MVPEVLHRGGGRDRCVERASPGVDGDSDLRARVVTRDDIVHAVAAHVSDREFGQYACRRIRSPDLPGRLLDGEAEPAVIAV